jgi:hypothetical protein
LFYSAATKREAEPIAGSISLESLTEIEDANHRSLALNLINLLIDASPNRLEINTLLLHPLFTQCNEDAQSRLTNQVIEKEMGQVWRRDKQNLQKWKSNLDQTKFPDDEFIKLEEIVSYGIYHHTMLSSCYHGFVITSVDIIIFFVVASNVQRHGQNSARSFQNHTPVILRIYLASCHNFKNRFVQ